MPVPSYLQYAAALPEQGALSTGIQAAEHTYGTLQEIQERQEQIKQAQMLNQALPGQIQREQKIQEQTITQGGQQIQEEQMKLAALPKDIQQRQMTNDDVLRQQKLLLDAMPMQIKQNLKSGDLQNAVADANLQVGQMQISDLKQAHFDNLLSEVHDLPDKLKNKQYQTALSHGKAMKLDMSMYPTTYNPDAAKLVDAAYVRTPAFGKVQKFRTDVYMQNLKNKGLIDAAHAKNPDPEVTEFQKKAADADAKYLHEDLPNQVSAARDMLGNAKQMEQIINNDPNVFGAIRGGVSSRLSTAGSAAFSNAANMVLDRMGTLKGTGNRMNMRIFQTIQASKPDPSKDTVGALRMKIANMIALATSLDEYGKFASTMESRFGITNRNELDNAWDSFTSSTINFDKTGNISGAENLKNWSQFYQNNPQYLPYSLQKKMGITPEQQPVQPSIAQTGIVPKYQGHTPSSILTGE